MAQTLFPCPHCGISQNQPDGHLWRGTCVSFLRERLARTEPGPEARRLVLPYPPSANRYWRNVRGRVIVSDEAKAYKDEVFFTAYQQQKAVAPVVAPVRIWLDFYRARADGDLDNRQKILLDALEGILYKDDKQIVEIRARRFEDKKNPRVELACQIA